MPPGPAPAKASRVIRAFVFDIGNVLLRFDFAHAIERLEAHCTLGDRAVLDLIEPIKREYESGRINRTDFQREVRAVLRYTGTDPDFVSAWVDIFTENEPMTEVVRQLHGRYPLHLLSNTSDLHMEYIRQTYPVFGLFARGVYSYEVRAFKPEREIFEIAIRELEVVPEDTLFIDDLAPNIEAARECGFQVWLYDWRDHGAFLQELNRLGVVLSSDPSGQTSDAAQRS